MPGGCQSRVYPSGAPGSSRRIRAPSGSPSAWPSSAAVGKLVTLGQGAAPARKPGAREIRGAADQNEQRRLLDSYVRQMRP